jgi:hypothetical protein
MGSWKTQLEVKNNGLLHNASRSLLCTSCTCMGENSSLLKEPYEYLHFMSKLSPMSRPLSTGFGKSLGFKVERVILLPVLSWLIVHAEYKWIENLLLSS